MYPKVSIIILNWNGWKDTIECLESLYQINYPNYDVIVVDNASTDNSIQKIKEYCKGKIKVESKFFKYNPHNKPIHVLEYTQETAEKGGIFTKEKYFSKLPSNRKLRLILNKDNYGFAGGCNIGVKYSIKTLNPDYVLLFNNDAVADASFLTELVNAAEKDERIGVIQSKILKKHNPKVIDSTGHVFKKGILIIDRGHDELDVNQYDKKVELLAACGASMLSRASLIREIGLFDTDFFCYSEDVDFSLRAKKHGWKIMYQPSSVVYHKRGSSSGTNTKNARKESYWLIELGLRNLIIAFNRNVNNFVKVLFFLNYLKTSIKSGIGKVIGRNNIGATIYIKAILRYLEYSNSTQIKTDSEIRNELFNTTEYKSQAFFQQFFSN